MAQRGDLAFLGIQTRSDLTGSGAALTILRRQCRDAPHATPCSAHGIGKSRRENCAELKNGRIVRKLLLWRARALPVGIQFCRYFCTCRRRCHWKRNLRQPGMTFLVRILSLPATSREPAEAGQPCVIEGPPRRCCRLARYRYERLLDGTYSMPGTVCAVPSNQTASHRGTLNKP